MLMAEITVVLFTEHILRYQVLHEYRLIYSVADGAGSKPYLSLDPSCSA